ncbi:MarR family winged helix-turn-helix transcriptional regulator [Candidatus Stoquefichus massiliensis]|uniref:MarR family winged helix-turn-helix transcriptional regulator n=1 Tax=Candidatus Stoquefichus massiliensis TaxID=1470350 RepID=UPI000487E748|nr:hypothetical protein [Candidatus Stoquefichus massiliensis]
MDRIEKRIAILYSLRRKRINNLLKEYHLTHDDYQIVMALHYAEGMSIDEIMGETKIDPRLIQHVLDHLVKRNYIEFNDNKLYLTEYTKKIYPQIKRVIKKSNEELTKDMSSDEYHEIVEILDKLIESYEI